MGESARCLHRIAAAAMLAAAGPAGAESLAVPVELWDRPRSGRIVIEQPVLRQAVNAWLQQPGSRLIVRHSLAQSSRLAAEELRSWLAALAVEPGRTVLRSDLEPGEPLRIEVVKTGDK